MNFPTIQKRTPAEVAAFTYRLTGGQAKPETVSATFRSNAAVMREYAEKAAASKTGKYRHYTAAQATEIAEDLEARAVSVPSELRKLIASAG